MIISLRQLQATVWNVLPSYVSVSNSTLVFITIIDIQQFAHYFKITRSNLPVNLNVMNFVQNHSYLNVLYTAALDAHTSFLLEVALMP